MHIDDPAAATDAAETLTLDDAILGAQAELNGEAPLAEGQPAAAALPAAPADPPLDAPAMWNQAAKDAWLALNGDANHRERLKALHAQYAETQKYITQTEQQRAQLARMYQPFHEVIQPYAQQWAMQGLSPEMGLRQVMSYAEALQRDPKGTLMELAQAYGVDLRQALDDQPWVDPATQQLADKVQQFERMFQSMQDQGHRAQQETAIREVRAFESEADAAGNPKYPYFDRVWEAMVPMIANGITPDLPSAYELACLRDPQIRAEMQAQQNERARTDALAAAQAKSARTQQAVAASGIVRDKGGKFAGKESLDDAIRASAAELAAR